MGVLSLQAPALAGVAVSPENIHLVQLKKARKGFVIQRIRQYETPAELFSEGKMTGFDALQKALMSVVRDEALHDIPAAVCVPSNQVKMQQLQMPAGLSTQDIETEICAEVNRTLPVKNHALAVDFRIGPAKIAEEIHVFFAAARKDYIQRFQSCFEASGLRVVMMDVDIFALLRAVRYALRHQLAADEKLCSLYICNNYAVIAAQRGSELLFHQQWDGRGITRLAMTCLQWVEWCCHTYRHLEINSLAVGGQQPLIYQAAKIIAAQWSCKIYEPDPFSTMKGASALDIAAMQTNPSSFLLACGLALRERLSWK